MELSQGSIDDLRMVDGPQVDIAAFAAIVPRIQMIHGVQ